MQTLFKTWGVGLTGGIASGKSTVAAIIARSGYAVIDADALAREVVLAGSSGLRQVVGTFGRFILAADGSLDRKKLATLVFANPTLKQRLEAIVHPLIAQLLLVRLQELGLTKHPRPWFYEAALIVETGRSQQFSALWVTDCPYQIQLERLCARNSLPPQEAALLIANQMPAAHKLRHASLVINTAVSYAELEEQVQRALSTLPAAGTN